MSFLAPAWRNLWRNRRRTAITLAALALNTAVLIITNGLLQGFAAQMQYNLTQVYLGEVQAHAPGFLGDRALYQVLPGAEAALAAAPRLKAAVVPRVYGYGLANLGSKSAGVLFWGVEPGTSQDTFQMADRLQSGTWLAETPRHGVILGRRLAHSLKAKIGSEITVVVQAADGSLGNDIFTVVGILKGVNNAVDRSAAILHHRDFRELFVLPQGWHELALNSRGQVPLSVLAQNLQQLVPGAEVKTWEELLPGLADLFWVVNGVMLIIWGAFILAAGLGVLNTMLMATYERKHEFGLLLALGTPPWRLVRNVAGEAALLALVATTLGALVGTATSWYLKQVGLDTRWFAGEFSVAGLVYDPVWRAALTLPGVMVPVGLMFLVCILAALYPAVQAARLDPVKTLYHA